jgi:hypothetical protein
MEQQRNVAAFEKSVSCEQSLFRQFPAKAFQKDGLNLPGRVPTRAMVL